MKSPPRAVQARRRPPKTGTEIQIDLNFRAGKAPRCRPPGAAPPRSVSKRTHQRTTAPPAKCPPQPLTHRHTHTHTHTRLPFLLPHCVSQPPRQSPCVSSARSLSAAFPSKLPHQHCPLHPLRKPPRAPCGAPEVEGLQRRDGCEGGGEGGSAGGADLVLAAIGGEGRGSELEDRIWGIRCGGERAKRGGELSEAAR